MEMKEIKAGEITAEIIEQQADTWKQAVESASEASAAYMQDLESRKAALEKQEADFRKEINDLRAVREKSAIKVNDLASRSQFDEAVEEEYNVERLDKTIEKMERKARMLKAGNLKGDASCYEVAKQAHEKAEAERQKCGDALSQLYQGVQAEISRLREIKDRISNLSNYVRSYGPDDGFDAVDRHFRELDRIEREARERWQAEQAAQKAAANKTKAQIVVPR